MRKSGPALALLGFIPARFVLVGVGLILIFSSFLVPFQTFLPAWTHWQGEYVVEPQQSAGPAIGLYLGTMVKGMLVVKGNPLFGPTDDGEILFSVYDSSGKTVVPESLVHGKYIFEFQSWDNTIYYFVFKNNRNVVANESLYWIVWAYWYDIVFLISGIPIAIAGISLFLKDFLIIRKEKTQIQETEKPKSFLAKEIEYSEGMIHETLFIKCAKCGILNDDKARFCDECGSPLK